MVKQISDNEIYLLIKYIKSVLWRVSKCLSYIEEARCLKVNQSLLDNAVAGNRLFLPGILGNTVVRGNVQLTNPSFLCACDLPLQHR